MATLGTLEYLISIDSSKVSSGLSDAEGKVQGFGNKLSSWAVAKGQVIGNMISKAGSATMDFVKDSVQESMGFDKAMSQVAATLGKSTDEMGQLSAFAREMGAKTAFSATQAAEALNYMALAGYNDTTSMKMLPTVLNLAAAGNMELATASDMVTDAQSALGLSIEETEKMVDQMAKTSSKTNTSVEQLGSAFLTVGGTAKMLRGGTTELSAVLGVLADNGIKGSEGGTALRNVILSLSAPTDKAAEALKTLGINVFDSKGEMRELPAILADINERTKNMSQKTKTSFFNDIFNKRDLKAVEALLATSTDRWSELYEEIGDADGAAEQMAETQLDNLAGDLTIFQSALSEAKLSLVEGLTPALRTFVQRGTNLLSRITTAFGKRGFQGVVDEAKKSFWSLIDQMTESENPAISAIGKIAQAFKTGFTWENLKSAIQSGWESIKQGVESLGKIVLGENVDGSIKWPTWTDIGESIKSAWDIKENVSGLAKVVFGENVDGSIKWPTWEGEDGIQAKVTEAWNKIVNGAKQLPEVIFGADSSVNSGLQNALQFLQDTGNWIIDHADLVAVGIGSIIASFGVEKLLAINPLLAGVAIAAGLVITNWEKVKEIVDEVAQKIEAAKTKIEEVNKIFLSMQNGGEKKLAQGQIADLQMDMKKAALTGNYDQFFKNLQREMEAAGFDAVEINTAIEAIRNADNPAWVSDFIANLGDANTAATTLQDLINGVAGDYNVNIHINTYGDVPTVNVPSGSPTGRIRTPAGWVKPDGSNAKGMWDVPYDNYVSELHRGEMVLNKSQARKYREGGFGGIDMEGLSEAIQGAIKSGMENATVRSYLNGRDITSDVNRRQIKQLKARRYAT